MCGEGADMSFGTGYLKLIQEKVLRPREQLRYAPPMRTILLVLLILLLLGALPLWPYSSSWGYFPGGGLLLLIILVLVLVKA